MSTKTAHDAGSVQMCSKSLAIMSMHILTDVHVKFVFQ